MTRKRIDIGSVVVLTAALGCYAAFIWSTAHRRGGVVYFSLFDDAMISMTYARNLAEGYGLVWNAGEPPVEGYSNFLWTVWMAVLHMVPVEEAKVSLLVSASGALILAAHLLVLARLADALAISGSAARYFALVATAFSAPLMFWTLRGMEVGLLCLLADLGLLLAIEGWSRRNGDNVFLLALTLCLGLLTRPDFLVVAGVVALSVGIGAPAEKRWGKFAKVVAAVAVVWMAHAAYRFGYYGDLLPNTYYLKMAGVPLSLRLGRGAGVFWSHTLPHLWPLLALAAVGLFLRECRANVAARSLAGLFVAQVLYSIYVGGDAWEEFSLANRYISIGLPSLILCGALVLDSLDQRLGRSTSGGLAVALAGILVWAPVNLPHFSTWLDEGAYYVDLDREWTNRGLRIREATPVGTRIAVTTAGAIPYFARRPAIDLLGKNDAVIARLSHRTGEFFLPGHSKFDPSYSIGVLRPELVVTGVGVGPKFYRELGYVRAPKQLGVWATPGLMRELGGRSGRPALERFDVKSVAPDTANPASELQRPRAPTSKSADRSRRAS